MEIGVGVVEVDGAAAGEIDRAGVQIGIEGGGTAAGPDVDRSLVDQIGGEVGVIAGVDRVGRARGDGHAIERVILGLDHGGAGGGEAAAVDRRAWIMSFEVLSVEIVYPWSLTVMPLISSVPPLVASSVPVLVAVVMS